MTESLAGRFEVLHLSHWTLAEMKQAFGWTVEQYIFYGGYPGAAPLITDPERWARYVRDSLIDTTISRDVLLLSRVDKPALLRRLFELGCAYSGQILSYTKMLGQLQDAGNTTTLAHYLELLEGAGMLVGLQKYAAGASRQRGSSPKLQVLNTALMTAQSGVSLADARRDRIVLGTAGGVRRRRAPRQRGCRRYLRGVLLARAQPRSGLRRPRRQDGHGDRSEEWAATGFVPRPRGLRGRVPKNAEAPRGRRRDRGRGVPREAGGALGEAMKNDERRRCGLCGKVLRPYDSISVADVGERCYRCFNDESADRLGIDFDNTPIAPIEVTDVDGVRHRFEIRSMLVGTGHAMSAREVKNRDSEAGYRFEILGDHETDAQDLFELLRERIRQGLSVRHVQQTEHGWQLTQAHRLSGVIEWDPETDDALPLLIVDGRTFTWDQIGRMLMTFEGFTLNAIVQDTIEVVGGPLADGRLESQASREPAPAVPAAAVRPGTSNRTAAARRKPTRVMASESASARRVDRGSDGGCLRRIRAGDRLPDHARGASRAAIWCDRSGRGRGRREDRSQRRG